MPMSLLGACSPKILKIQVSKKCLIVQSFVIPTDGIVPIPVLLLGARFLKILKIQMDKKIRNVYILRARVIWRYLLPTSTTYNWPP